MNFPRVHAPWEPAGRATYISFRPVFAGTFFNPHSPGGERQYIPWCSGSADNFQSTHPVGDATYNLQFQSTHSEFSIHASRGESDSGSSVTLAERSSWHNNRISRGTEVLGNFSLYKRQWVQRHAGALRGESDQNRLRFRPIELIFNPRSPWGERQWVQRHAGALRGERDTLMQKLAGRWHIFSIHALRGESDC